MAVRHYAWIVMVIGFTVPATSVVALAQDPPAAEDLQAIADPQGPRDNNIAPSEPQEQPAEPESHGTRLRWQDIPKNVLHDEAAVFTSPLHINKENVKWWVLLGGSTAALAAAADQKFADRAPQVGPLTTPSRWASRMGADYTIFPLWSTFYFVGKVGDNPRARDTGRIGIEALIDADLTAAAIKAVTQRPRPEIKGESVAFFKGGDAFPSGHSIKSWALARVLAREFPHPRIVPVLAYALAGTVSVARVSGRRHSPSDALAGAAIGYFIGDFVYRRHHAPSEQSRPLAWLSEHVSLGFEVTP